MSMLNVNSIPSLEALNRELTQYQTASDGPFHRYALIFREKVELLAQLDSHFQEKISQAEAALNSCEMSRSGAALAGVEISCAAQEEDLRRAQANYSAYQSAMSQLCGAQANYESAASRYESNLNNISASIAPNFLGLIAKMHTYETV
jgi:hypothetical protein